MSDALDDLLKDSPADEKAGANASLGFTYQQWWGTLAVVDLLKTPEDFAVGMEIKEDVAILDSPEKPTRVEFCQIKKYERSGVWTLSDLKRSKKTKSQKDDKRSTLAKLYHRRHEFQGHPTHLRFVSNVAFKVPAGNDSLVHVNSCGLDTLAKKHQDVLKANISDQLAIDKSTVDLTSFKLERTNLPLGEQEIFVAGKLNALCESGSLPFTLSQPTVAAKVLASELQSRGSDTGYAVQFSDLSTRLFSRAEALTVLAKVSGAKHPIATLLDEAIARLDIEKYPYQKLELIRSERARVCALAVDRTNMQFRNVAKAFLDCKDQIIGANPDASLGDLLDALLRATRLKTPTELSGLSEGYLFTISLLVLKNGIDIDVLTTSPNPKSEEEK